MTFSQDDAEMFAAFAAELDELRKAQRAHERIAGRYKETTEKRNALVRQALAEGWTHAAISEATGLSRGRIGQIGRVA